MTTTASSAANSSSHIPRYSMDASTSRSRSDSSPWLSGDSQVITNDPAPSVSSSVLQDDPCFPSVSPSAYPPAGKDSSDHDNADKKPVWNKPSNSSTGVPPVTGAESWPALSLSARASSNKSPSLESFRGLSDGSSTMPVSQAGGDPLNHTHKPSRGNANANANSSSSASENHSLNGQKRPFRRNASSSSNTSYPAPFDNAVAAPLTTISTRDQTHTQRGASFATGTTQYRNSHRNRNNNSYPRGDGVHHHNHGNRRHYDHGNQSGFPHRNHSGRGVHLQPPRGLEFVRPPQMLMGPPYLPASSAQYMSAPQIGPYGGPMLYPDFVPHLHLQHQPPESMGLFGHFPPQPMYFPGYDPLYSKILAQVDYYFSADNLSTESYLRQQMNDEGWVLVSVIAKFRKLAELTTNTQTILDALRISEVVEIQGEALRRRGDWKKYLWPRELSGLRPAAPAAAPPAAAPVTPPAAAPAAAYEPNNSTSVESKVESMTL